MLKVRVIPILLLQDGLLKKPVQFKNPRTVANPITIVRVFEERQVDELILLDIGLTVDQDEIDSSDSQNLILNSASVLVPIGAGFNLAFRSKKLMELSVITASAVATGATTAIDIADLLPFQHDKMPGDVVIFTYVIGSKLKGNPYTNHSKNVQFTKLRRIRKDN